MTDAQRAQLGQLQFYQGIVAGELALVSGCAEFLAGLPNTMQLDHRAEQGRQRMAAAIETLRPLLQLAAHQLTGQIAGLSKVTGLAHLEGQGVAIVAEPPPVPAPAPAPNADLAKPAELTPAGSTEPPKE